LPENSTARAPKSLAIFERKNGGVVVDKLFDVSVSESAQLRQKGRVKDDVARLGKTPKFLQHLWVLVDDFSKGFGFQLNDRTE